MKLIQEYDSPFGYKVLKSCVKSDHFLIIYV